MQPLQDQENILQLWTSKERDAWKPPEQITVSEWADKNRVLPAKSSARPGPWKTERVPYLREIMDTFNDPWVWEIDLCFGAQGGKTETLLNCLGYAIDQDPGSALFVQPTESDVEDFSKERIKPTILECTALREKFDRAESSIQEFHFWGMFLSLSGAGSDSRLASKPIRYIFFDEIDKYPSDSGGQGDPISQASKRQTTFRHNKKTIKSSTPTLTTGRIWREIHSADILKKYYVPCPHCGKLFKFEFKDPETGEYRLKWPKELTDRYDKSISLSDFERNEIAEEIRENAYYECPHCKGIIEDFQKPEMLRNGEWRVEGEIPDRKIRKVAYHINSIASPWVRFGDVAAEFIKSKDDPQKLKDFVNQILAEPWEEHAVRYKSDIVFQAQAKKHERLIVPDRTLILTAGVDVQKDHFYYTIRAWWERVTSCLVDYGLVEYWEDLEEKIVNGRFYTESGQQAIINLCLVDSGYNAHEVYDFCARNAECCLPSKGASANQKSPFIISQIDKSGYQGLDLAMVDTVYYKDLIFSRMQRPPLSPGSWSVYQGIGRDYADQICSEQKKQIVRKGPGRKYTYEPVSEHVKNHLLDCEVYAACAAEIRGIRHMYVDHPQPAKKQKGEEQKKQDNWIPDREGWFRR